MSNAQYESWVARARAVRIENEIARRGITLTGKGAERVGPCPKCGGTDRFSINTKEQQWNCRGCMKETDTGDVIGLVMWLDNCDFITACTKLNNGEGPPETGYKKENRKGYVYRNADRTPYLLVTRIEATKTAPKRFYQFRWNGSEWKTGKPSGAKIPYRLPECLLRR
jgi:phage/plasmid primase-like uncharacterized protein